MKHLKLIMGFIAVMLIMPITNAKAQGDEITIAVLNFEVKGEDKEFIKKIREAISKEEVPTANTLGEEFAILLTEQLTSTHSLALVEREKLDEILSEMELGLSGTIDPESAAKIGHLAGAKIIVTGRMFPVKKDLAIVAKIISVETGRVYGKTITMPNRGLITDSAVEMGVKIAEVISEKGEQMIAKPVVKLAATEKLLPLMTEYQNKILPIVSVSIKEKHIKDKGLDPAAETEIIMILQQLGFTIVDPLSSTSPADVEIEGEAFSAFGLRKGNLVSSKGRVEIKAIERMTGKIILAHRQNEVAVDLSRAISGRMAVQKAAAILAEKLVPALLTLAVEDKPYTAKAK